MSSESSQRPPNGNPCWLQIPAHNVQRAVDFYRSGLGVDIKYDPPSSQEDGVLDLAFIKFPGTELGAGILKMRGSSADETLQGGREYGYAMIYTYTDDLEDTVEEIRKAGGKILMPRTKIDDAETMGWFSDYRDTEGNFMGVFTLNRAK